MKQPPTSNLALPPVPARCGGRLAARLALALAIAALAACGRPLRPVEALGTPQAASPGQIGVGTPSQSLSDSLSVRVRIEEAPAFAIHTIQQAATVHRSSDIRSSRVELFRCTTQAAAQAADPSLQAGCSAAGNQVRNHPAGITSLNFTIGNLRQNSFYSARVSAYSAASAGGSLMGQAWPVTNAGLRELVRADANAALSLVNDMAPLSQLDLTLQLGNTTVGGSVSNNTLGVSPGNVVLTTSEAIDLRELEVKLNPTTAGTQSGGVVAASYFRSSFVGAWHSNGQDGSGNGIYAQIYSSSSSPTSAELQVNQYTSLNQSNPAIARSSGGGFVVAWMSEGQDGDSWGVYARVYNLAGTPVGPEFLVNTSVTAAAQEYPAVAFYNGQFVVVWSGNGPGASWGVFAQRYDSLGNPQGSTILVNSITTLNAQPYAKVAMDRNGNFVIAWRGNGSGDSAAIYARRYDSAGTALGPETRVNTTTLNTQQTPAIGIQTETGRYMIAWVSDGQDGSGLGIYAQRFDAGGTPRGAEFRANSFTTGHQQAPSLAADYSGNYLLAWQSANQDGSLEGIYAQRFNPTGDPQGDEFRLNTYTSDNQQAPSLASFASGRFIAAWQSNLQDGSFEGVYSQLFGSDGVPE